MSGQRGPVTALVQKRLNGAALEPGTLTIVEGEAELNEFRLKAERVFAKGKSFETSGPGQDRAGRETGLELDLSIGRVRRRLAGEREGDIVADQAAIPMSGNVLPRQIQPVARLVRLLRRLGREHGLGDRPAHAEYMVESGLEVGRAFQLGYDLDVASRPSAPRRVGTADPQPELHTRPDGQDLGVKANGDLFGPGLHR